MNKNTITTAALAATLATTAVAEENKDADAFTDISGSVSVGYGINQLGNYGFTLIDEPYQYAALALSSGPFSFFTKPKIANGEFAGAFSELSYDIDMGDAFDLSAKLQHYDVPWYDTFAEAGLVASKDIGPFTAKLGAFFSFNGSDSIVTFGEVSYNADITDKLHFGASTTLSNMIGDYHGVTGLGGSSTAATLSYDVTDDLSVFGLGRYNHAFDEFLEDKFSLETGVKWKF